MALFPPMRIRAISKSSAARRSSAAKRSPNPGKAVMSLLRNCISNCARARHRSIRRNISLGFSRRAFQASLFFGGLARIACAKPSSNMRREGKVKRDFAELLRGARDIPGLSADLFSSEWHEGIGRACCHANGHQCMGKGGAGQNRSERKNNGEASCDCERRGLRLSGGKTGAVVPRRRQDRQGKEGRGARQSRRANQDGAGKAQAFAGDKRKAC